MRKILAVLAVIGLFTAAPTRTVEAKSCDAKSTTTRCMFYTNNMCFPDGSEEPWDHFCDTDIGLCRNW